MKLQTFRLGPVPVRGTALFAGTNHTVRVGSRRGGPTLGDNEDMRPHPQGRCPPRSARFQGCKSRNSERLSISAMRKRSDPDIRRPHQYRFGRCRTLQNSAYNPRRMRFKHLFHSGLRKRLSNLLLTASLEAYNSGAQSPAWRRITPARERQPPKRWIARHTGG